MANKRMKIGKIKKTGDLKCWGGNGETGVFIIYCCLIQPRRWPHLVQRKN